MHADSARNRQYVDIYDIWIQQQNYNERIMEIQQRNEAEWMINYILGTMSELGELLQEMRWKTHRLREIEDFGPNVSEELADITKYVFSMWQLLDYTPQMMLDAVYQKGLILDQIFKQELNLPTWQGENIIILDLDGVVADFREGFSLWIRNSTWAELLREGSHDFGLHMDINNGWDYSVYEKAKLEFEESGGYSFLPPMQEVVKAVKTLRQQGFKVLAWTARPSGVYKRIWADTWLWLLHNELELDGLYFGSEERVTAAKVFQEYNLVTALEDNPVLAQRYAASEIPVILVPQPYNRDLPENPWILTLDPEDTSFTIYGIIMSGFSLDERSRKVENYDS